MSKKTQVVFVYGSLKRGFHNHHLLETSELLGEATSCDRFVMWGAGFPFLASKSRGHRVAGELYLVDLETLQCLDHLEGHPRFYRRQSRLFRTGRTRRRAWIYLVPQDRYQSSDVLVRPDRDSILRWSQEQAGW